MPGVSATTAGTAFGFALQVYINSVRKLPLTRSASKSVHRSGSNAKRRGERLEKIHGSSLPSGTVVVVPTHARKEEMLTRTVHVPVDRKDRGNTRCSWEREPLQPTPSWTSKNKWKQTSKGRSPRGKTAIEEDSEATNKPRPTGRPPIRKHTCEPKIHVPSGPPFHRMNTTILVQKKGFFYSMSSNSSTSRTVPFDAAALKSGVVILSDWACAAVVQD